ncbi:MAG TPA: LuxR C-terminal-related transcriptional regulator [Myxococcota bacterium]|nr:LuxR C-terminal-related transcriptional regulator [Myxococcota bacterium]
MSPKEYAVAILLALGHRTDEVARLVGVAVKTVDTHRGHVMHKLGLAERGHAGAVALCRRAYDEGLLVAELRGELELLAQRALRGEEVRTLLLVGLEESRQFWLIAIAELARVETAQVSHGQGVSDAG